MKDCICPVVTIECRRGDVTEAQARKIATELFASVKLV